MKKLLLVFVYFFRLLSFYAAKRYTFHYSRSVSLLFQNRGYFHLSNHISINAPAQPEVKYVTDYLKRNSGTATGYSVLVNTDAAGAVIRLSLNNK